MALANATDVQQYLPQDQLPVVEPLDATLSISAERVVKGMLAGVFTPVTLASWATPDSTPALIREIAALLIASQLWGKAMVGETPASDVPGYAQDLYNRAISYLQAVRAGTMTVDDGDGSYVVVPVGSLEALDYFPDDSTAPMFSLDLAFGP